MVLRVFGVIVFRNNPELGPITNLQLDAINSFWSNPVCLIVIIFSSSSLLNPLYCFRYNSKVSLSLINSSCVTFTKKIMIY